MRPILLLLGALSLVAAFPEHLHARALREQMRTDVSPCDDFFEYVCGAWIANTTLPPDSPSISKSFTTIQKNNNKILQSVLETMPDSRIGQFYKNCMDQATIDARGTDPLNALWLQVSLMASLEDFMYISGVLQSYQIPSLLSLGVVADAENPGFNVAEFDQGGYAMPDRSLYLDDSSASLRADYLAHMGRMFALMGLTTDQANAAAQNVMLVETVLANASLPGDKIRDPFATYHKIDLAGLQQLSPALDWASFLKGLGADFTSINVGEPSFFAAISPALVEILKGPQGPDALVNYLQWQLLHGVANLLPSAFVNETFAFFGRELQGQSEPTPRNEQCIAAVDAALGDELGKEYVAHAFPGQSLNLTEQLINTIISTFSTDLNKLDWMDPVTLSKAQEKLSEVIRRVGFPDPYRNYSGYVVIPGQHFESTLSIQQYLVNAQISQVGKPVDRTLWEMTPSTVNAYYEPTSNSINFPAGILQNPFFDASFSIPVNYGGIGMVMGHELSHGFDDQGRLYDGHGKLTNWWANSTSQAFQQRAQCLIDQYSNFEILPGVHVNGALTLGENIADNGGIKTAFNAYRSVMPVHEGVRASRMMAEVTNDQLFFISFATGWCTKSTDDYKRLRVKTDVHSPPKFRVIGPLQNLPAFATAFNCPAGSYMNPTNKCQLW